MLNDRKKKILQTIVEDYIENSQPVGSKKLVECYDLGVSPATIRNEMAELEEMGYLDKPHTSAGRVPSTLGYRVYVDSLMQTNDLKEEEVLFIKKTLENEIIEVNEIVKNIGKAVSDITDYTVFSTGPDVTDAVIEDVKLILLGSNMLLIVVLTKEGSVKETVINLSKTVTEEVIQKLNEIIRIKLKDEYVKNIKIDVLKYISNELSVYVDILFSILNEIMKLINENDITLDGRNNIFKHPEFKKYDLAKSFLDVLEAKQLIKEVLQVEDKDVNIYIGDENEHSEFKDFSLITFKCPENLGIVGIIGPTRMDYAKVLSVIKYINQILKNKYKKGGYVNGEKE